MRGMIKCMCCQEESDRMELSSLLIVNLCLMLLSG